MSCFQVSQITLNDNYRQPVLSAYMVSAMLDFAESHLLSSW